MIETPGPKQNNTSNVVIDHNNITPIDLLEYLYTIYIHVNYTFDILVCGNKMLLTIAS